MIKVKVYLEHDNVFKLQVLENGSGVDLISAGVNRVVIKSTYDQIDSDTYPEAIDYTSEGADGVIAFDFSTLTLDVGKHICAVIIYDPNHLKGQVWDDVFYMNVHSKLVT